MSAIPPPDPSILSAAARRRIGEARGFVVEGSVDTLVALDSLGLRPLGLVHGASSYEVTIDLTGAGGGAELAATSQALYTARQFALARMLAEATQWRADGVIDVRIEDRRIGSGREIVEMVVTGTAVAADESAAPGLHADGVPFTTAVPIDGLAALLGRGLAPLAVLVGTCAVRLDHREGWPSPGEVPTLTQAAFDGRELALARIQADADRRGAAGLLGVRVERRSHAWEDLSLIHI